MYKRNHELEQTLGANPPTMNWRESLGYPQAETGMDGARLLALPLTLETPINEDVGRIRLGNFIEDQDTPTPSQSVYTKLLSEKINEILDSLPYAKRAFLRLRFGLENGRFYNAGRGRKKIR